MNLTPQGWDQGDKNSKLWRAFKKQMCDLLEWFYIGVHNVVSVEWLFSIISGSMDQRASGLIRRIILEVFVLGEYQTIFHPKVGVWIRYVYLNAQVWFLMYVPLFWLQTCQTLWEPSLILMLLGTTHDPMCWAWQCETKPFRQLLSLQMYPQLMEGKR